MEILKSKQMGEEGTYDEQSMGRKRSLKVRARRVVDFFFFFRDCGSVLLTPFLVKRMH